MSQSRKQLFAAGSKSMCPLAELACLLDGSASPRICLQRNRASTPAPNESSGAVSSCAGLDGDGLKPEEEGFEGPLRRCIVHKVVNKCTLQQRYLVRPA